MIIVNIYKKEGSPSAIQSYCFDVKLMKVVCNLAMFVYKSKFIKSIACTSNFAYKDDVFYAFKAPKQLF